MSEFDWMSVIPSRDVRAWIEENGWEPTDMEKASLIAWFAWLVTSSLDSAVEQLQGLRDAGCDPEVAREIDRVSDWVEESRRRNGASGDGAMSPFGAVYPSKISPYGVCASPSRSSRATS